MTSVTSVGDKDDAVAGEVPATDAMAQAGLPIWPIVGTCVGAAVLILLLATRRRDKSDATEGRRG